MKDNKALLEIFQTALIDWKRVTKEFKETGTCVIEHGFSIFSDGLCLYVEEVVDQHQIIDALSHIKNYIKDGDTYGYYKGVCGYESGATTNTNLKALETRIELIELIIKDLEEKLK